jgi:hypothetical protein
LHDILAVCASALKNASADFFNVLVTFDEVYDIVDESEKKDILSLLVKEAHINANDVGAKTLLRKIIFNFPVYYNNDNEADQILWETQASVETLVCLARKA